jgi:hypothetical protein
MSLPVKRYRGNFQQYNEETGTWFPAVVVLVEDLAQLEADLLNAQRTVQAFRELIRQSSLAFTPATKCEDRGGHPVIVNDGMMLVHKEWELELKEKTKTLQRCAALARENHTLTRERDNARAALEAMTKDRDNQRALWNAAESEMWTGELREQLAAANELNATLQGQLTAMREELAMTLAGADADAFTIGVLNTKLASATEQRDRAFALLKAHRIISVPMNVFNCVKLWDQGLEEFIKLEAELMKEKETK